MGRFIIDRDESGKAVYQYVYGNTYDDAYKKVQIGMEVELRFQSGKCISVLEVYREWITAIANRVKESSFVNYCNNFINKKLSEGFSASYIKDIITVFKSMLIYAQEEYGFSLSLKNVILPKTEKKKAEKFSDNDQKVLISHIKEHMTLTGLGILISLYMGLRIGELCGLTWADIDIENRVLYVHRTVQRICTCNSDGKKTKIIISVPKSDTSFREIAIPEFLAEYFIAFKGDDNYYVLSGSEKIVEPRAYQYRYKSVLSESNSGDHTYHGLRHTFATNCIQNGFDVKTLSMILGHKTVNITLNRYVHPDYVHERKLMNKLAMLF